MAREIPLASECLPALLELAQTDLQRALAHIATLESHPTTRQEYNALFDAHAENLEPLLAMAANRSAMFLQNTPTVDRTTTFFTPVLSAFARTPNHIRLAVGQTTREAVAGSPEVTVQHLIRLSVLEFATTVTTREAAERALAQRQLGTRQRIHVAGTALIGAFRDMQAASLRRVS